MPENPITLNRNLMYKHLMSSFARTHQVHVSERDSYADFNIVNPKGQFLVRAYWMDSFGNESLQLVQERIDLLVSDANSGGVAPGFVFLRCLTSYEKNGRRGKNVGSFLKQMWHQNYNVKKLTTLELAVEELYDKGQDYEDYRSRLLYFDSKKNTLTAAHFRPRVNPYACLGSCRYHLPKEKVDFRMCKTDRGCTNYAWHRDEQEVKAIKLTPPYTLEIFTKENFFLGEIKRS